MLSTHGCVLHVLAFIYTVKHRLKKGYDHSKFATLEQEGNWS